MKWLVLLLLVANAIYLGWELDQDAGSDVNNASASLAVPRVTKPLVLLEELKTAPAPRAEPEPPPDISPEEQEASGDLVTQMPDISVTETPAESIAYSCFTFGPLPEEKHAVWLGDWFHARRGLAQARSTQDPDRKLFWVYLAQKSRSGADAVIADLQKKGVRDYRLISRGDLENSISLGLFSTQAAVNERLQELKEKGYAPVVVPYANLQRIYWLDVKIPASAGIVDEMFHGFPSRYRSVPVRCDQIAIAAPAQ